MSSSFGKQFGYSSRVISLSRVRGVEWKGFLITSHISTFGIDWLEEAGCFFFFLHFDTWLEFLFGSGGEEGGYTLGEEKEGVESREWSGQEECG